VREWLSWCKSKHSECSSDNHPPPQLPSRVIDVGSENEEPHLHISQGECAPYVTLSHCWGRVPTLITTTYTLKDRKLKIPLSTLPNTYRDAVMITRGLAIKYLWIDSLCIVQDDKNDWEKESLRMAQVYSNAEMLIAASDAANSSEGCLHPREPPWRVNYSPANSETRHKDPEKFLLVYPHPSFHHAILTACLNTRAWCLQEAALSRRTLHCTKSGLYWQCGKAIRSECGLDPQDRNPFTEFGADRIFNLPSCSWSNWRYPWWIAVMDYSSRQLSFQGDKLAAMSGITNFFCEKLDDKAVFGLWMKDLHSGLLWRCGSAEMHKPPELAGLPTWSWAALDGPVRVAHMALNTGKTTNRAGIDYVEDSSSARRRNKLVITGRMIKAPCSETIITSLTDATGPAPRYGSLFSFRGDILAEELGAESKNINLERPTGWYTFDLLPVGTKRIVYCLEISSTDWRIGPDLQLSEVDYFRTNGIHQTQNILILYRDSSVADIYRRIGIGMIDSTLGEFECVNVTTLTVV
jgi:hypothetical protein